MDKIKGKFDIGGGNSVQLFWTGGWDSTYRLVELSRQDVIVQPVYVCDPTRQSIQREKRAMTEILDCLKSKKETRAVILDTIFVVYEDIPENAAITAAYNHILEKVRLGSQYDYLARFALYHPGIEIGIEKPHGEFNGCDAAVDEFGAWLYNGKTWVIDSEKSSEELNLVFGNISFPIRNITEQEMVKNIHKWGYEDVMQHIWFCYTPVHGKPCGKCRPCQQKMDCGMEFLLPESAHKRYARWKRRTEFCKEMRKYRVLDYMFKKAEMLKKIIQHFRTKSREKIRKYKLLDYLYEKAKTLKNMILHQ